MSDKKLWEISDEIERVINHGTDRETGEISDEAIAELEALEMAQNEKALACGAYIKGELMEAEKIRAIRDALKAQADGYEQRAVIHDNRAERLRAYLENYLESGTKLSDARSQIAWQSSTAVKVLNFDKLHTNYVRKKIMLEADKVKLKEALTAGETVEGAELEHRIKLRVK